MSQIPETPYLLLDISRIGQSYESFRQAMPTIDIHYAMKCNPDVRILKYVAGLGGSFEIASSAELDQLISVGVDPSSVIYSNPVKPPAHLARAHEAGVWRFAFDSPAEVDKLAAIAPGSAVYVRLAVNRQDSTVPSEGKYGIASDEAIRLMSYAASKGLRPYGIAFHVGSQMEEYTPWVSAIRECGSILKRLSADGIRLEMVDIGGGFPAYYSRPVPSIETYGKAINEAVATYLPSEVRVIAEPGRYLAAEAGVMVATIIGVAERHGKVWLHLDVGAFNGLMESLETQNELHFPLRDSRELAEKQLYNITGPTCDSQDTMLYGVMLSKNLTIGDQVYIETAGAYTTSYASTFNGFAIPETILADAVG